MKPQRIWISIKQVVYILTCILIIYIYTCAIIYLYIYIVVYSPPTFTNNHGWNHNTLHTYTIIYNSWNHISSNKSCCNLEKTFTASDRLISHSTGEKLLPTGCTVYGFPKLQFVVSGIWECKMWVASYTLGHNLGDSISTHQGDQLVFVSQSSSLNPEKGERQRGTVTQCKMRPKT